MRATKPHPSVTAARLKDAISRNMFGLDNPGFCIACGYEQEGCEPDAENYECESCGAEEVFGAQEIALRWSIT